MRIIYTSDTHSYIFPTDYVDECDKEMGLLKLSQNFTKDEDTLVIDGGDIIQGSPLATYLRNNNLPFIQADILNEMKVDIVVPGNHDFNYGHEAFCTFFNSLKAEVLACNLVEKTNTVKLHKHIIKEDKQGIKYALIGAVTEYINVWEKPETLKYFTITSAYEAVKAEIEKVKASVDKIIVIYHGGVENDLTTGALLSTTCENEGYKMAMGLDIDLLLTAHQHLNIPLTKVNNTYLTQVPANAIKLLDITINKEGVVSKEIHANNKATTSPYLKDLNTKINAWLDTDLASINEIITKPTLLDSASKGSRVADFFNHVILDHTKADVSATALFNDLFSFGPNINIREIVKNYKFQNSIVVYSLNKDEIKEVLERAAEYFTLNNGALEISESFLRPKVENYNYDYYLGLSYTFDISKPKGQRVTRLLFEGKEIDRELKFAVSNYRSTGAGGYDIFKTAKKLEETTAEVQELSIEYLLNHKDNLSWPKADFILKY